MPVEVDIKSVEDGAILADDVLDARGNVLLAAKTQITKAHLSLIGRRGITTVRVMLPEDMQKDEEGEGGGEAVDPARLLEALAELDAAFAGAGENPIMTAIHKAARAHLEAGNLPPA